MIRKIFSVLIWSLFILMGSAQSISRVDTGFTQLFRRTSGWTAGDATISLELPDQRSLWFFGDSYLNNVTSINGQQRLPCIFSVRNAVMVQAGKNFSTLLDTAAKGLARTFFKTSDNVANDPVIWPNKGYIHKDTAFIFLSRVNSSFQYQDGYLAKMTIPDLKIISLSKNPSIPDGYNFGVSVLKNLKGDSLYIYGVKPGFLSFDAFLARCPINKVLGTWDYYTGKGWSSTSDDLKKLPGTNFSVSPQYSIFPFKGKYYLVTQEVGFLTCNLGREIYGFQSTSAFGPFTDRQVLYTIQDTLFGDYMKTYNAEVHLQFSDSCTFLVSYNVNGACKSECNGLVGSIPADSYRPKFVRVPWSILDPALNCSPVTKSVDFPESEFFQLFPNPSSGQIEIKIKPVNQTISIDLFNIYGQLIRTYNVPNQSDHIKLDIKESGVLYLRLRTKDHYLVKKLMVQH
ncbi:MAG: DUF5005 domain-containing protein [Saprospiraceae bacterium]